MEPRIALSEFLISVKDLRKSFRQGFWMRRVDAVKGVSFGVPAGSIFGFLGPNGAGKTTTIKMLTGLIAPTSGEATLFGQPIGTRGARARLGFLPENPYIYPYLTPREFVEMSARLSGLAGRNIPSRTRTVLEEVGIWYAADRPVRRLSKGMLQRAGLAAALVADPELLVLDEPMSGLDPVGRKEVRDLIFQQRHVGRTIFFSTHILSDVEVLCDQVTILRQGEVVVSGELKTLLKGDVRRIDVVLLGVHAGFEERAASRGYKARRVGERLIFEVEGEDRLPPLLRDALDVGLRVAEVNSRHETLEDLFLREAIDEKREVPSES
ncbi:MAG: ABC transporter ATP-binding protein [Polyangiaceae bacterium]|nr:ABC transporter ATP-binding protein [Polyangiaceae bacterium]